MLSSYRKKNEMKNFHFLNERKISKNYFYIYGEIDQKEIINEKFNNWSMYLFFFSPEK